MSRAPVGETRTVDGIRLTVPPEIAHSRLVRAVLRDILRFRSEDHESRFLLATTEIVVNAVRATENSIPADEQGDCPIVVETAGGCPPASVVVSDAAGGFVDLPEESGQLGAGLTIARTLVSDMDITAHGHGTRVRLGLDEATV